LYVPELFGTVPAELAAKEGAEAGKNLRRGKAYKTARQKEAHMLPTGTACFRCTARRGQELLCLSIKVTCGRSYLERALEGALYDRGLMLPDGTLRADRKRGTIDIVRAAAVSEGGPCVFYGRHYRLQGHFDDLMEPIDRMLAGSYGAVDEQFMCEHIGDFLIGRVGFNERALVRAETGAEAKVEATVRFASVARQGRTEEEADYSVCLNRAFVEESAQLYEQRHGRPLSAARQKALAAESGSVGPERFLRALDIRPLRSIYEMSRRYRNLEKCISFLADVGFRETDYSYYPDALSFRRRED
jgi:hypothetical protein